MKQIKDRPKNKRTSISKIMTLSWAALLLIVVFSLATGIVVNFLNNLYYSNLLNQANNKAGVAQTELGKERYDVKFLLDNTSQQINCYDLRSSYVRNLCYKHENLTANTP